MKRLTGLFITLAVFIASSTVNANGTGILTGGQKYNLPDWFTHGFLEFDHEVSEANKAGKQVIAFFHLDECPYCVRMLDENFRSGETRQFILQIRVQHPCPDGDAHTGQQIAILFKT